MTTDLSPAASPWPGLKAARRKHQQSSRPKEERISANVLILWHLLSLFTLFWYETPVDAHQLNSLHETSAGKYRTCESPNRIKNGIDFPSRERLVWEVMTTDGFLIVTLFCNLSQFGSRVVISPFVLTIATTFNASKGEIGAVLTVLWAVFACLQFPSGVLGNRFGERRIILVSMSLTTIGSLAIALAQSILGFVFAALVLGIGTGLYFSVGSSLLARLYENSGQVLGLHSAGAPLAGLVFPSVAVAVVTWFSWRVGVALGAVGSSLAAVFVAILVTPTPAVSPEISLTERLSSTTLRSVFGQPSVIFATIIATIGMYAFQALVSFSPTFLVEYHGFSERTASLGFGLVFYLSL